MSSKQTLIFLAVMLSCSAVANAQQWSGIIAPSRAVDWGNVGVSGGIPNRTTICATLNPGATAAQINSVIAACPSGQVVYLNAGTYALSSGIHLNKGVTLRGAGADGTIVNFSGHDTCFGQWARICVWNDDSSNWAGGPAHSANWTAGYSKGGTQVTLSSTTGLAVGYMLILDQIDDSNTDPGADIWICEQENVCSSEIPTGLQRPGSSACTSSTCRGQQQLVTVTGINGSIVTISPGLYMPNWRSGRSPGAWWGSAAPLSGAGVENLSIGGSDQSGSVVFLSATNSWVKGIRSNFGTPHIELYQSTHITVRDSYFFLSGGASNSYGIQPAQSSDCLIENNIFQQVTAPLSIDGSASGLVWAYNYSINNLYGGTWMEGQVFWHSVSDSALMEGNVGNAFEPDAIHGTHAFGTAFRNYYNGWETGKTQQTIPMLLYAGSRFFNVIGNVLGRSGYHNHYECAPTGTSDSCASLYGDTSIFSIGFSGNDSQNGPFNNDLNVKATLMRWGNYDTVNSGVRWVTAEVPSGLSKYANPVPGNQNLPASFYLSAKPVWWPGSKAWPPIGPNVTGGNIANVGGHANTIPAQDCYTVIGGPADGTGNILSFNAASCYGQTAPSPPLNLIVK